MARARVRGLVIQGVTSSEPSVTTTSAGDAAKAPRTKRTSADKIVPIEEEMWHIHGPAMSRWTEVHIYWVLPLGAVLLFCLVLWSTGFSFRQGRATTPVPVVASSPASAPAPQEDPPSASSQPVELTPEELDRRHTEYLRGRNQ